MVARMKARRRHRHRQDQRARVRPGLAHLQPGVRHHAERLGHDAQRRRQQRRRGGGAGAAAAAGGRRQRHDGLAAQPGRLEQRLRPAPEPGPRALPLPATATWRSSAPKARWAAPCATWRCCCRCRPATTRASRCRSRRTAAPSRSRCSRPPRGLRIGWLGDLGGHLPIEPGILPLCEAALRRFEALGALVEPHAPGLPLRRGVADLADVAALPRRRHARPAGRRPGEARAAEARGAVGIRPGPGPERPAGLCGQRQPHALLPPHGRACSSASTCWCCPRAQVWPFPADGPGRARSPAGRWTPTTAGWRW